MGRLQGRGLRPALLYGVTLGRTTTVERIPYARKPRQLPVILSADELARFFAAAPSLKHRTALMISYAAGLWVSEVVRLKIADIDSRRLLGHRDLSTTARYTRFAVTTIGNTASPVDRLKLEEAGPA